MTTLADEVSTVVVAAAFDDITSDDTEAATEDENED